MLIKFKSCPFCGNNHTYHDPTTSWSRLIVGLSSMECPGCGGEYIKFLGVFVIPVFRPRLKFTQSRHKNY